MNHPFGWISLAPPLAAIILAVITRRILVSLLAGIFFGALVMARGDFVLALNEMLETHLWRTLIDEGKMRVFSFTLLMGAMVGVISRSGGMRGLVELVTPLASTRRRGQLSVWFLGLLVFFDDYANTILLGSTLRPLCDKLRISRAKLAYLVDSTAAPVAGLALISTWIAVELEYLQDGLDNLPTPMEAEAFGLFVASIPYRFYVLLALLFVPMVAILGRDFGSMLSAERACLDRRGVDSDVEPEELRTETDPDPDTPGRWWNAAMPIFLTLAVVVYLTYSTGLASCLESAPDTEPALRSIMGNGDSSFALQRGALAGLVLAGLLAIGQRVLSLDEVVRAAGMGAKLVLPAIAILWFASTVSRMTGNKSVEGEATTAAYQFSDHRLYTGDYLQDLLLGNATDDATDDAPAEAGRAQSLERWLPTTAFLLAAVVAFSTGTSFGTMGILLPMIVSLSSAVITANGSACEPGNPIFLCCIGGILAGAIFGDHCSPISDTTVLSSQSSGCDHMLHVWTQLPYALTIAFAAVVLGTIPIGFGVSVWILLPIQFATLVIILRYFGKNPEVEIK